MNPEEREDGEKYRVVSLRLKDLWTRSSRSSGPERESGRQSKEIYRVGRWFGLRV